MPVPVMPTWVQDQRRPSPVVTWLQEDGTAQDLTGVTSISGVMREEKTGVSKTITGNLAISDAVAGTFIWTLSESDVDTAGSWKVQFTAAYSAGATPAVSYEARWTILTKLT